MMPAVVRYGMSFKTALVLLDLAVMVKVFFEVLYTDEVIVTVSITVMVVLAVLEPPALVALSEMLIIVLAATAGAVYIGLELAGSEKAPALAVHR